MAVGKKVTVVAAVLSLLAGLVGQPAMSCGPFLETAIYSYTTNPDFPLKLYAGGDLGVVRRSYARSYLVVAYRYLVGKKLDESERQQALNMWKQRLGDSQFSQSNDVITSWLNARKKVPGASKIDNIEAYRPVNHNGDYPDQYPNCMNDAFINATNLLAQRITKYGANSAEVKEWLGGQDAVFCHCQGPEYNWQKKTWSPEPPFPSPYTGADSALKADRAYQIAAAHFYSQMFDLAAKEFLAIAADSASPYKSLAPYLAARALLRQCSLADKVDDAKMQEVETRLKEIASNKDLASLHASAQGLIQLIECRLHPVEQLRKCAEAVLDPAQKDRFGANLSDYTKLLDKYMDVENSEDVPPTIAVDKIPAAALQDDLTDWIFTFNNGGDASRKRALQKWSQTHSLPWLVAAATCAGKADASKELMDACGKVPPSSPAYFTVAYNQIRLLLETGKKDEAQRKLAEIMAKADSVPPSALNLFLDQSLAIAGNLDAFLKTAIRKPSATTFDYDAQQLPENFEIANGKGNGYLQTKPAFRDFAATYFNHEVPLSLMMKAAQSSLIPANLKRDVTQAVWLRSFMLKGSSSAAPLTGALKAAEPALAPYLSQIDSAKDETEKAFAMAYMVLKFPGMRPYVTGGVQRATAFAKIDDYQDNWWCADSISSDTLPDDKGSVGNFLTAQQAANAKDEFKRLVATGTAPDYLCNIVNTFARTHKGDARVPEALYLSVHCTRFGCKDDLTSKRSAESFQLIHKNYPNNPWAKKTKYHY